MASSLKIEEESLMRLKRNGKVWGIFPGLEISVFHQTMTDRNKGLTDLKLFHLDIISKRKTKT